MLNPVGQYDIGGNQEHIWANRPVQGQVFTTGSNAGGYTLSAITVREQVNQASTISPDWEVRVGSLDETGVFTPLVTETITGVTIPNGIDNWVTWTLGAPLQLEPNTGDTFDVASDLQSWGREADDGIESGGESMSCQQLLTNLPLNGPRLFFRVRDTTGN